MPVDCFVRKNHLTINEDPEIWEIVACDTGDVVCFGTERRISEILGSPKWDHNSNVVCDDHACWIE